ncbi:MAG: cyclic pyranopterin monophosphate synthase MoaC [Thermoproteota archaeon]
MNEYGEGLDMIDITSKKTSRRTAVARGRIRLRSETLAAIRSGRISKGDVFSVAKVSGILAAKKTSELIPGCHPIPITHIAIDFQMEGSTIVATCRVSSESKTGVEMEALTSVSIALLTVWDMVKEMEKDDNGQYPYTAVESIIVERKVKEE